MILKLQKKGHLLLLLTTLNSNRSITYEYLGKWHLAVIISVLDSNGNVVKARELGLLNGAPFLNKKAYALALLITRNFMVPGKEGYELNPLATLKMCVWEVWDRQCMNRVWNTSLNMFALVSVS